ncbi:MAG: YggS family pyridoxal phosphate-dependent enzyme [Firmicutes bacterium]|nr:YggS family pyridoxal phosphate-dependent enzyme [Bacillota bacterium]
MVDVIKNLQVIKKRVAESAMKTNRKLDDIKIIAVTKNVEVERILEAIQGGIDAIGENRVQEALIKYPLIEKEIEWHMIGYLQRNKAKKAVEHFDLIQSLDRISLAQELDKRGKQQNKIVNVLVQVNVSGEESKSGISPEETVEFIKSLSDYENILIKGLMTIAPYTDDPEETRPYFKRMKGLFDEIHNLKGRNIDIEYLSMGMTNDFEVAIEEGSNMIRVGTGIFGERNY